MGKRRFGGENDRLFRAEVVVYRGESGFILVVCTVSCAADDDGIFIIFAKLGEKPVAIDDFDVFDAFYGKFYGIKSFFKGQKSLFLRIDGESDDDFIKKGGASFDYIEMSEGYRVERARNYRGTHNYSSEPRRIIVT